MACRTKRTPQNCCGTTGNGCNAATVQYKPFTKTFYNEKMGWQTKVGSWNYPAWAVRYLPPARQRTKCCKKC